MMKLHLLINKEEIQESKLATGRKVAVVFDVLLATTTITAVLTEGAAAVIPAENPESALKISAGFEKDFVIAGELHGKPIEGFAYPSPAALQKTVQGKTLLLSTTNGTVALKKAASASIVYLSCLMNNPTVAETVRQEYSEDSVIMVICSGNSSGFSLEDFYGAGHFIDCLQENGAHDLELTDAAKAALFFYRGNRERPHEILSQSRVGQMLEAYGMKDDLELAASIGISKVVPLLRAGKVINGRTKISKGGREKAEGQKSVKEVEESPS
ncbi:2-phosphosulfolactate phosphatase [Peribacillus deserti]|uniref:Probable 2-phosphosulfolactate phosphatase n=1 Tax=Peribacillus deserti TaxID=673318 RepID=A0A2N5M1I8_9BACI|nr:2-phosphosulfolactate phosphatase [Peribacillus deserti]PLT28221.1 2-phosphosulfolactate phosphatase [Peribacillus deserti]